MSQNVEVVRRAFDSFNRRDLAVAVAALERDAEWVPYLAALEQEIYRGRDDTGRMWREVLRDVPDLRLRQRAEDDGSRRQDSRQHLGGAAPP
jgi:ketosteroid isomerase-like protein